MCVCVSARPTVRLVVAISQRTPSSRRFQLIDSAKVQQVKRVQKNKSQLTNINNLSTDFQWVTFFVIKKNKIRNNFLLVP